MEQREFFSTVSDEKVSSKSSSMPLAARMRPHVLEEFFGQEHLLGSGKLLQELIRQDQFHSLIFYGPPGTGKTTLAHLIAKATHRRFVSLSAVISNVAEVRRVIDEAQLFLKRGERTILFVDEIHRFNKAQQDVLLPHIENGVISFIGATTHNPFFSIVSPLISRSQVFRFHSLKSSDIEKILKRALLDSEKGFGKEKIHFQEDALSFLANFCEGDARRALNILESVFHMIQPNEKGERIILKVDVNRVLQEKAVKYDWDEDEHYDTISAFIKSVRGSDPDAAIYWLAKMIQGGEDILFIARRLVILASEDIGNADPRALTLATSCLAAVEFVGLPEARIPLAQTTIYLACAPKSNSAYLAIDKALEAVKNERLEEVPSHLKNVKGPDEKEAHYLYPHDFDGHFVEQSYVNNSKKFLELSNAGYETQMLERLKQWRQKTQKKSTEKNS